MKPWLRRVIGVLTLGGGFLGLTVGLQLLFATQQPLVGKCMLLAFICAYGWGCWVGMRLLEQAPRASDVTALYWLAQVPMFSSPLAAYTFAGGSLLFVTYTVGPGLGVRWQLGSTFEYSLLDASKPWKLGINLFALSVSIVLLWDSLRSTVDAKRSLETNATSEPGEGGIETV